MTLRDAVEQKLSAEQRLLYHQQNSAQLMEDMKIWMEQRLEGKHVEPNSGLGSAIKYMLKRWDKLTLFLRQALYHNILCPTGLSAAPGRSICSAQALGGAKSL